jgi:dihydrofolate reductase
VSTPIPIRGGCSSTWGPEQERYKLDETLAAESLLLGRVTYEGFSAAWPQRKGEFADKMNSMPKHVVSATLSEPLAWSNSAILRGDAADAVAQLKEEDGGPILVAGSCTLVRSLIENDLIDELRLMVFPVLIGGGKRIFPDSRQKKPFELTDTQTFETGVAVHTYKRADA